MPRVHAIVYLVMGKNVCIKKTTINGPKKAKVGVGGHAGAGGEHLTFMDV